MTRKDSSSSCCSPLLCAIVAIASPQFLSAANLQNLARLVGMYGIFSIGVGLVIITGGIDLSVGSICALLGILLSMMLVEWHWPAAVALAAVVALGARPRRRAWPADHAASAAAVHRHALRICCSIAGPPATSRVIRRKASAPARDSSGCAPRVRKRWRRADAVCHLCVVAVAAWVLLHRSVYGRHLFAVGRNEEAARYSGVNTRGGDRLGLRDVRDAGRGLGGHHRLLHELDLARVARQLLRALRDCRRRGRRLQPARRRRIRRRASSWARRCCRCCGTWSTCWTSRARSISR